MRIFVTGATGFVGSNFLNFAFANGHSISAMRRSTQSNTAVDLQFEPDWVVGEMCSLCERDFDGCDALLHLASHSVSYPFDSLENCLKWNVVEPLAMFRKASSAGLTKIVVAGSCYEYGRSGERYDYIPTDAPLEPTQSYSASKAAASIVFYQLAVELKLRLSIHRIFHVYGPGQNENRLWPSLRKAAETGEDFHMTGADQVRDFIHVDEVARSLLDACVSDEIKPGTPKIHNLGTGRAITIREFAEHWWRQWEAKGNLHFGALKYRDGEIMRCVPQI